MYRGGLPDLSPRSAVSNALKLSSASDVQPMCSIRGRISKSPATYTWIGQFASHSAFRTVGYDFASSL